MARPVVLVHGAWHGSWCWDPVTPHLDRAGVPWVALDLPSVDKPSGGTSLDDVPAVLAALDQLPGDEPAVLVGHSRGGMVISEAGMHERVGHLVYLAAVYLQEGESTADFVGDSELLSAIEISDDGWSLPVVDMAPGIFYNDCSDDEVAFAVERLRRQHMTPVFEGASREAWRHRPSTYVVCEQDLALPAASQHLLSGRIDCTTVSWNTGHSPFLNRPDLVGSLLVGLSVG